MHQTILAKRRASAITRISERASALVAKMDLGPEYVSRLQSTGIKDPVVADLYRLEAVADLLDKVAEDYSIKGPVVVDNEVHSFIAPVPEEPEPPVAEEPVPTRKPQPTRKSRSTVQKKTSRRG